MELHTIGIDLGKTVFHLVGLNLGSRYPQRFARFGHFEHRVAELLMRKLTLNSPAVILIELDGPSIRLDHSKAKCAMSTAAYFTFGMCQ